mmetsp:Transcript_65266/g.155942  ORF Transcript_65266/g.155942 Transcript_65266/m.155942 type:complete len:225 (+) Transcript_65266:463-1137(+)
MNLLDSPVSRLDLRMLYGLLGPSLPGPLNNFPAKLGINSPRLREDLPQISQRSPVKIPLSDILLPATLARTKDHQGVQHIHHLCILADVSPETVIRLDVFCNEGHRFLHRAILHRLSKHQGTCTGDADQKKGNPLIAFSGEEIETDNNEVYAIGSKEDPEDVTLLEDDAEGGHQADRKEEPHLVVIVETNAQCEEHEDRQQQRKECTRPFGGPVPPDFAKNWRG